MENIKQTGLINIPPSPTDWLTSGESGITGVMRMPSGDWREYKPSEESQAIISFDTLSCVSFSALNIIETFLKYYIKNNLLSKDHLDFLHAFGFIRPNGDLNISDRFTAIMSNTSLAGNTFTNVWNSIKTDGLLPEFDLPFGGTDFSSYHDKSKITPYMKMRAKKFLEYFSINYEWVFFSSGLLNTGQEGDLLAAQLKEAPLHAAVPILAYHAEELVQLSPNDSKIFFDTYPPYTEAQAWRNSPINYALKAIITPKTDVPKLPTFGLYTQLKQGVNNSLEVLSLQRILSYLGFMNVATGNFGPLTYEAVKSFQIFYGVDPIGEVGPQTREKVKQLLYSSIIKENRIILYEVARACIGRDITPEDIVPDEVACAATVNAVYKMAFGSEIGGGASTTFLYRALVEHKDFIEVIQPLEGDIIISPTGYSAFPNTPIKNGHVGIVGVNGIIMSNSSSNGLFSENFNMISWKKRYQTNGGYPIHYFRRK